MRFWNLFRVEKLTTRQQFTLAVKKMAAVICFLKSKKKNYGKFLNWFSLQNALMKTLHISICISGIFKSGIAVIRLDCWKILNKKKWLESFVLIILSTITYSLTPRLLANAVVGPFLIIRGITIFLQMWHLFYFSVLVIPRNQTLF